MVLITIVNGGYKPTNITGGHHPVLLFMESTFNDPNESVAPFFFVQVASSKGRRLKPRGVEQRRSTAAGSK